MRKGSLLLFFSFLLFSSNIKAQNLIRGTIIDATTEQAIAGVSLVWDTGQNKFSTITDESGVFEIQLNNGSYSFKSFHISYEDIDQEFIVNGPREVEYLLESNVELAEEVLVKGIRAKKRTPVTFYDMDKAEIRDNNLGQDLPFVLDQTPAMLVTSDAGGGVGYTGMRIRGVDPTRINVTINGIPLNDAESHGVFWVNLPDIASSVSSIQIQRGVGTSTNGAAAFGASVNIKTDGVSVKPFARMTLGGGSFNTTRYGLEFGTGLIDDKWGIQGRVSGIRSDGFIDRSSSDLSSMFLTAGRYWANSLLKLVVMKGFERTDQAWYGVPQPKFNENEEALSSFIEDLGITGSYRENLLNSNSNTYNYYTYENQVDNYNQDHYQAFFTKQVNGRLSLKTAAHYTRGYGYFEEYQDTDNAFDNTAFSFYGLENVVIGSDTVRSGDFIRRRWLDNHLYGLMASIQHVNREGHVFDFGVAAQQYIGDHFGEVIWAEFASNGELGDRYYENRGVKTEANSFAKYTRQINKRFTAFGDLQVRWIDYDFEGPDRNGRIIDQNDEFIFFNPKFGLGYTLTTKTYLYGSYAQSNREPIRNDYVESTPESRPESERLQNIEIGARWEGRSFYLNGNLYAMEYNNQLVLTGRLNDVGAATRENVEKSFRRGIELEGGFRLNKKLEFSANLNVSSNKIVEYKEFVDDWVNGGQVEILHENTDIALSPSYIANLVLNYRPLKALDLSLINKAVGDQYLDNTSSSDRKLNGFYLLHFRAMYDFQIGKSKWQLSGQANNILDLNYAPNGYTFGGFIGDERRSYNYVYPQAGRNFLFRLMLSI